VFNAVIGVLVGTALVTAISITLVRLHDLLRLIRGWR